MEVLPNFQVIRPESIEETLAARLEYPGSRMLGGGTDLVVNLRRGIGDDPPALIEVDGIQEMKFIDVNPDKLRIGTSTRLTTLAEHPGLRQHFPVVAEAAASVAGPTHRNMGTLGGNLCLDTRCVFYNQSEWWRSSNDYCLKYSGSRCHVAPKSRVCYATYSGDLAPALSVLDAEVEIVSAGGRRRIPLQELFSRDGGNYLNLKDEEFVSAVIARPPRGLRSGYDKLRVRRSIDFPLAGAAVALKRKGADLEMLRVAFTGTNPWPVMLEGTEELCGDALNETTLERLDALVRKQVMSLKTTFTSGHYRRNVARVLARRLATDLFNNQRAAIAGD